MHQRKPHRKNNKVFDFVDLRKIKPRNYVLAAKLQPVRVGTLLTWDKTAFLQGQSNGVNLDVVCQLSPKAYHPPCVAARLKKPSYDMNDAPRRWWNILDKAVCRHDLVPTQADRYCYFLYSTQTSKQNWNQTSFTQGHRINEISLESRARSKGDAALEKMLDPIEGSPATGKSVAGIINLFVEDRFGTCGTEMEQRVLATLRKDFQVGSEDWNDLLFTVQRIRWMKEPQSGPSIEVSQEKPIKDLEEIPSGQEHEIRSPLCTRQCIPSTEAFQDRQNSLQSRTTAQVAASETSILAIHKTVENNCMFWCLSRTQ